MTNKALETMSLAELIREKESVKEARALHRKAAASRDQELTAQINTIKLAISLHGYDTRKIAIARDVLVIDGAKARAGNSAQVILDEAMKEIAAGGGRLRLEELGTVFRIGLQPNARRTGLSQEEIEAALYYLVHIDTVQSATKPTG